MKNLSLKSRLIEITEYAVVFDVLIDEENEIFEERIFETDSIPFFKDTNLCLGDHFFIHINTGYDFITIKFEKCNERFGIIDKLCEKMNDRLRIAAKKLEETMLKNKRK